MKKRLVILTLVFVLITSHAQCAADVLQTSVKSAGTSNGDWSAIALMVSGVDFDKDAYINALKNYVTEKYTHDEKLSRTKSTEWHRIAIAANLSGENARNLEGIDLVADGVYYRDNIGRQGLNGYIWALICLESTNANEPNDAINTRESILNYILTKQNDDGGFALSGKKSSCDITAMAIYALSFYSDRAEVKNAIDSAKAYLYSIQNEDGSFSDGDIANAESTSQVIIALSALGEDVLQSSMYSALLSFETPDGFSHIKGEGTDTIATYQAICAISATKEKKPIYSNHQSVSQSTASTTSQNSLETKKQENAFDNRQETQTDTETQKEAEEFGYSEELITEINEATTESSEKNEEKKTFKIYLYIIPLIAVSILIIRRKK